MLQYETMAKHKGYQWVAGVDEAGRGPLAGPVVAAAVILPGEADWTGLDDSKKLTPEQREAWEARIKDAAWGFGFGIVAAEVIDEINILQASRLAMKQAVENLSRSVDLLLIDGNQTIDVAGDQWPLVGGDGLSCSIAASSVLAKVARDRMMRDYHRQYPQYEFHLHKGYGTRLHRERIRRFGPCPIHRKTFKGVQEYLNTAVNA